LNEVYIKSAARASSVLRLGCDTCLTQAQYPSVSAPGAVRVKHVF